MICDGGQQGTRKIDILSTRVSIVGVSERDIDLLLLEEFQSSPPFQAWFISQVLGVSVDLGVCVSEKRSVTHSTGESDLEITFLDSNKSLVRLFIQDGMSITDAAAVLPIYDSEEEKGTALVLSPEAAYKLGDLVRQTETMTNEITRLRDVNDRNEARLYKLEEQAKWQRQPFWKRLFTPPE